MAQKERQERSVPDSDVIVAESRLAADETMVPEPDQFLDQATPSTMSP
jgi:hypothetical protein